MPLNLTKVNKVADQSSTRIMDTVDNNRTEISRLQNKRMHFENIEFKSS